MQLDICTRTLVACPVRPFCLTFWSTCPTLFYPDMSLNELLGTSTFPRHLRSCHEILHSLWQLKPWTALLNTQRDISRGHLSESVSVLSSCTEWRRQTGEWLVSFFLPFNLSACVWGIAWIILSILSSFLSVTHYFMQFFLPIISGFSMRPCRCIGLQDLPPIPQTLLVSFYRSNCVKCRVWPDAHGILRHKTFLLIPSGK